MDGWMMMVLAYVCVCCVAFLCLPDLMYITFRVRIASKCTSLHFNVVRRRRCCHACTHEVYLCTIYCIYIYAPADA